MLVVRSGANLNRRRMTATMDLLLFAVLLGRTSEILSQTHNRAFFR